MADRKRLLSDLRVIDLRLELEKRNLDKSGVRGVLIERLSKHLEGEGKDPNTFVFETTDAKTPTKRSKRAESTVEAEPEDTPTMEDMVVQDDVGDEDDTATNVPTNNTNETMEVEPTKISRKRESTEVSNGVQAKKTCTDKDAKSEEDLKISENNTDAEDSINLDIGEDELLNDETEHSAKTKKDEEQDGEPAASGDGGVATDNHSAAEEEKDASINSEAPATSDNTEEKKDKSVSDDKDAEKEKKEDSKDSGPRNLWVSGLSGDTRAKDLKQLCSKHGKVIGAKVVTNARTPGSRCYGYVTMASAQDAENCIKNLHRTELHGRLISVEKAKSESESGSRRHAANRNEREGDNKDDGENKDDKESKPKAEGEEGSEKSASENKDKVNKYDKDKDRSHRTTKSREHRRSATKDVLSFSKIWKERDLARARERSRAAREDDRRRRAAEEALRERERRQRQERHRLELEREKLRSEREKIEREKNELLRLERERHRLEREKLELERMELKRAQLRLEEERRKRSTPYETSYRKSPPPTYDRDSRHKRAPPPPLMSSRSQFEAPPPPRFELAPAYERAADKRERDYKREYPRHVSASSSMKYPPNGSSTEDSRTPMAPSSRPKEPSRSSYEARESRPFRSSPSKPEPRTWNSTRYQDSIPAKGGSSSEAWPTSGGPHPPGTEPRYGGANYEARYPAAYTAPPAAYADRYPARDYRNKY